MPREPQFQTGQRIADGYRLLRYLGGGQDGEVWQVEQISLGMIRAAKLLNTLDGDRRERFDREIRILAKLGSPYIVTIVDRGTTWNATTSTEVPFYVMEYIEDSAPLDEALAAVPRERLFKTLTSFFSQTARALAFAHQHGIAHGDVKAANVLVLKRDNVIKLSDFGFGALPGEISDLRSEYPDSSYRTPPGLDAYAADIYKLGRTFADLVDENQATLRQEEVTAVLGVIERLVNTPSTIELDEISAQVESLAALESLSERSGVLARSTALPELQLSPGGMVVRIAPQGEMVLSERAQRIVDHPLVQRLRYIRERPLEHLAFPSATSTYFEDAIATFGTTVEYLRHFVPSATMASASDELLSHLLLFSLIAPVGEYTFSELIYEVFDDDEYNPVARARRLLEGDAAVERAFAEDWETSPARVFEWLASVQEGIGYLFLATSLGPRALARVFRLAWHTGQPTQSDVPGTISALQIREAENAFVVDALKVPVLENYYLARSTIQERVESNMTVRSARGMLRSALEMFRAHDIQPRHAFEADEPAFLRHSAVLADSSGLADAAELFRGIEQRKLHRRVTVIKDSELEAFRALSVDGDALAELNSAILGILAASTGSADGGLGTLVWDVSGTDVSLPPVEVATVDGLESLMEFSPLVSSVVARRADATLFAPAKLVPPPDRADETQETIAKTIQQHIS